MFAELAGTRSIVERPTLSALDDASWHEVAYKLREAQAESHMGRYGDAITDAAVALESALRLAGFQGRTLGERIKAGRRGGAFDGVDAKLGDALTLLAEWVSGARNTKSDAHDGAPAFQADADLTLRLATTLAAWLAETRDGAMPDVRNNADQDAR